MRWSMFFVLCWITCPWSMIKFSAVSVRVYMSSAIFVCSNYWIQRHSREEIQKKCKTNNKNCLFHHDIAPAHTSVLFCEFSAKNCTVVILRTPYSPHMISYDFPLFPKIKKILNGRRFTKHHNVYKIKAKHKNNLFHSLCDENFFFDITQFRSF